MDAPPDLLRLARELQTRPSRAAQPQGAALNAAADIGNVPSERADVADSLTDDDAQLSTIWRPVEELLGHAGDVSLLSPPRQLDVLRIFSRALAQHHGVLVARFKSSTQQNLTAQLQISVQRLVQAREQLSCTCDDGTLHKAQQQLMMLTQALSSEIAVSRLRYRVQPAAPALTAEEVPKNVDDRSSFAQRVIDDVSALQRELGAAATAVPRFVPAARTVNDAACAVAVAAGTAADRVPSAALELIAAIDAFRVPLAMAALNDPSPMRTLHTWSSAAHELAAGRSLPQLPRCPAAEVPRTAPSAATDILQVQLSEASFKRVLVLILALKDRVRDDSMSAALAALQRDAEAAVADGTLGNVPDSLLLQWSSAALWMLLLSTPPALATPTPTPAAPAPVAAVPLAVADVTEGADEPPPPPPPKRDVTVPPLPLQHLVIPNLMALPPLVPYSASNNITLSRRQEPQAALLTSHLPVSPSRPAIAARTVAASESLDISAKLGTLLSPDGYSAVAAAVQARAQKQADQAAARARHEAAQAAATAMVVRALEEDAVAEDGGRTRGDMRRLAAKLAGEVQHARDMNREMLEGVGKGKSWLRDDRMERLDRHAHIRLEQACSMAATGASETDTLTRMRLNDLTFLAEELKDAGAATVLQRRKLMMDIHHLQRTCHQRDVVIKAIVDTQHVPRLMDAPSKTEAGTPPRRNMRPKMAKHVRFSHAANIGDSSSGTASAKEASEPPVVPDTSSGAAQAAEAVDATASVRVPPSPGTMSELERLVVQSVAVQRAQHA